MGPTSPFLSRPYRIGNALGVELHFRNQDGVCSSGDTSIKRDPTSVPAHDLDDHHSRMRVRRRVQTVDLIGGKAHRRVKTERAVGSHDVVVDRLWHTDDRHPEPMKLVRDSERPIATDDDKGIELELLKVREALARIILRAIGPSVG